MRFATAYTDEDPDWKRTAVFCMRLVDGFDDQVLGALQGDDTEMRYNAVRAAGEQSIAAAWPHIVTLVSSPETDKPLLLAAIQAAGEIRPEEAGELLIDLADSDDDDVAEAADAALFLAKATLAHEIDDDDGPYIS